MLGASAPFGWCTLALWRFGTSATLSDRKSVTNLQKAASREIKQTTTNQTEYSI
jgi:hypothetical protein